MAAQFGTLWLQSPAGQYLEERMDGSKDGVIKFELPSRAQHLYKWEEHKGIEFTTYHVIRHLGRFLKCMETKPTSDGNMGWVVRGADDFFRDHMMNRYAMSIIGWVVTVGLCSKNARSEACLNAGDYSVHT